MDRKKLYVELVRDEGLKPKPYTDTAGKLTIGIGHNLTDNGLPLSLINALWSWDVDGVVEELDRYLPWWKTLDEVRQRVVVNLGFNLGIFGLLAFRKTLASLKLGRYDEAADELLQSKWATQVGARATRLAQMLRTGQDLPGSSHPETSDARHV